MDLGQNQRIFDVRDDNGDDNDDDDDGDDHGLIRMIKIFPFWAAAPTEDKVL